MNNYDANNIFAKIISGALPSKKIFENKHFLAIHDINPIAKIHALAMCKGPYTDCHTFLSAASVEEVNLFNEGLRETLKILDVEESGYRLISNCGADGGQEVSHFHVHILGGEKLTLCKN